jgi:Uma2 family endonuclease
VAEAARRDDWPRTVEEFERWHVRQPERWEFIDGRPRLMAPASLDHTIIKTNIGFALRQALADRGCTVLVDGAQILTEDISAIPDVVVTCSPLDHSTPVIGEPTIIVEFMSPASEADDTQRKWLAYRWIPSLRHYILVLQEWREVLLRSRAGDVWQEGSATSGSLTLDDPPVTLALEAVYAGTDVPKGRSRREWA